MKPADQTPFRGISGWNKKRCASKLPRLRRCRKYTADLLHMAVKAEIGAVFSHVLENAGVYKQAAAGQAAYVRYMQSVGFKKA